MRPATRPATGPGRDKRELPACPRRPTRSSTGQSAPKEPGKRFDSGSALTTQKTSLPMQPSHKSLVLSLVTRHSLDSRNSKKSLIWQEPHGCSFSQRRQRPMPALASPCPGSETRCEYMGFQGCPSVFDTDTQQAARKSEGGARGVRRADQTLVSQLPDVSQNKTLSES